MPALPLPRLVPILLRRVVVQIVLALARQLVEFAALEAVVVQAVLRQQHVIAAAAFRVPRADEPGNGGSWMDRVPTCRFDVFPSFFGALCASW